MAYCKDDNEAAQLVAQKLGSYPDTSWDNVDHLVRRILAMIGYRPVQTKPIVLQVVEILKSQGKFNDWGDPSNILESKKHTKHRKVMDDHFARARAYLYGFPTATHDCKDEPTSVTPDATSTTSVTVDAPSDVTEDDEMDNVADGDIESDDEPMSESSESPMIRDDGWFSIDAEIMLDDEDRDGYDSQFADLGYHVDVDYQWGMSPADDCPDGIMVDSMLMRQDPQVLAIIGSLYGPGAYDTSDFDDDDIEEGQDAIVHIPRDQQKSLEDEVEVGGSKGEEQDMNYIMRMRSLAGIK